MAKFKIENVPLNSHFIAVIKFLRAICAPEGYDHISLRDAKEMGDSFREQLGNEDGVTIEIESRYTANFINNYINAMPPYSNFGDVIASPAKPEKQVGHDSTGNQFFNVPNTPEGNEFISYLRENLSPRMKIRMRGRGKNRPKGCHRDLKPCDSEWIAVYIDLKDKLKYAKEKEYWENIRQIKQKEIAKTRKEVAIEILNNGLIPEIQEVIEDRIRIAKEEAKREMQSKFQRLIVDI